MKKLLTIALVLTGLSTFAQSKSDFLVGGDLGLSVPIGGGARDVAGPGFQIGVAGEYFLFNKLGLGNDLVKNISVTANLNHSSFAKKTYSYGPNYWENGEYKLGITTASVGANWHFMNPGDQGLGLYVGLGFTYNMSTLRYDDYNWNNGNNYWKSTRTYSRSDIGVMPRFGMQYGFNANWVLNAELGTNLILGSANYNGPHGGSFSYMPINVGIRYRFKM
jgi:hypothetical protein